MYVLLRDQMSAPGMQVVLANGDALIVQPSTDGSYMEKKNGTALYIRPGTWNSDLKYAGDNALDMVKVYSVLKHPQHRDLAFKPGYGRDLLWKREEPKEMTIEEIEKELGYSIKIVKG